MSFYIFFKVLFSIPYGLKYRKFCQFYQYLNTMLHRTVVMIVQQIKQFDSKNYNIKNCINVQLVLNLAGPCLGPP